MPAAQPPTPRRGPGRPRRQARLAAVVNEERKPSGTWIDDSKELAVQVRRIVGNIVGNRGAKHRSLDRKDTLRRLADLVSSILDRDVTREEIGALECLVFGAALTGADILRTLGKDADEWKKPQPVSIIVRTIMQWRDGLSDQDVRRFMYGGAAVEAEPAPPALILKYDDGQPVLDADGTPIVIDGTPLVVRQPAPEAEGDAFWWVAGDDGQPSRRSDGTPLAARPVRHQQRPVQKLIFR